MIQVAYERSPTADTAANKDASMVSVSCSNSECLTNTLPEHTEYKNVNNSDLIREYKDIFVRVGMWRVFEYWDMEQNDINAWIGQSVPDFVTKLNRGWTASPVWILRYALSLVCPSVCILI